MPGYEELAADLAHRIATAELSSGAQLPSARALAESYGTSSATAGRALRELARARIIEVAPRRRSVIAADGAAKARAWLRGTPALRLGGSDDPALARLIEASHGAVDRVGSSGSGAGVTALWKGEVEAAALHLRTAGGVYNAPFVSRVLADRDPLLVRLWRREQGILARPDGPLAGSPRLADLVGSRVALRPVGTGTRVLLEQLAHDRGIDPSAFSGPILDSHIEVAMSVATGTADVGIGLRSAADLFGLSFVPLAWEPFDLALPASSLPLADPLVGALCRTDVRDAIGALGGYDLEHAGTITPAHR